MENSSRPPLPAPSTKYQRSSLDPELVSELRRSYEEDTPIKVAVPDHDAALELIKQGKSYAARVLASFRHHYGTTDDGQLYLSFALVPKRAYTKRAVAFWEC